MTKIDLIMSLYNAADETGKPEISAAMDALNNTFKALISFMPSHLLRGDKPDADIFDAARDALQTLKRHADAQNIDFPMPEDERAFRMYIIDYGREVLFRRSFSSACFRAPDAASGARFFCRILPIFRSVSQRFE